MQFDGQFFLNVITAWCLRVLTNPKLQDNLQKEAEPPEPDEAYENMPQKALITDGGVEPLPENHYDEPQSTKQNGDCTVPSHEEQIYESIAERTAHNYVEMIADDFSQPHYEPMGPQEADSNLYESVELKPQLLPLPTTSLTDYSEESPDKELKCSAKDRMLLSCDDTSTLLFTQTVTSPMLTPSEENIDFLKGFQRESVNLDGSLQKESEEPPVEESENFYENTEFYKNTTPEDMYENVVVERGRMTNPSYPPLVKEEDIYENIEDVLVERAGAKSNDTDEGSLEEFIRNEREVAEGPPVAENQDVADRAVALVLENSASEKRPEAIQQRSETGYHGKYTEVVSKQSDPMGNREKDTESVPPEIVKQLKSQFQNKAEVVGIVKKVASVDVKSANMIEQIKTRFEASMEGDDDQLDDVS